MSDDALRRAYGLGPRIAPEPPGPSPLWLATEQARREFRVAAIAFSNQEATETQLLAAARQLRNLQRQWAQPAGRTASPGLTRHREPQPGQASGTDAAGLARMSFPGPASAGDGTPADPRVGGKNRPAAAPGPAAEFPHPVTRGTSSARTRDFARPRPGQQALPPTRGRSQ